MKEKTQSFVLFLSPWTLQPSTNHENCKLNNKPSFQPPNVYKNKVQKGENKPVLRQASSLVFPLPQHPNLTEIMKASCADFVPCNIDLRTVLRKENKPRIAASSLSAFPLLSAPQIYRSHDSCKANNQASLKSSLRFVWIKFKRERTNQSLAGCFPSPSPLPRHSNRPQTMNAS